MNGPDILKRIAVILTVLGLLGQCGGCGEKRSDIERNARSVGAVPRIRPDYCGLVIPPNIGPLNFIVCEKGDRFFVSISGDSGNRIDILSADGRIQIPPAQWRDALASNTGRALRYTVYARQGAEWKRFREFSNRSSLILFPTSFPSSTSTAIR